MIKISLLPNVNKMDIIGGRWRFGPRFLQYLKEYQYTKQNSEFDGLVTWVSSNDHSSFLQVSLVQVKSLVKVNDCPAGLDLITGSRKRKKGM